MQIQDKSCRLLAPEDQELQLVTKPQEWQVICEKYGFNEPEDYTVFAFDQTELNDLVMYQKNYNSQNQNVKPITFALRPKQKLTFVFKYLSYRHATQ